MAITLIWEKKCLHWIRNFFYINSDLSIQYDGVGKLINNAVSWKTKSIFLRENDVFVVIKKNKNDI
jgi:hypothetical protein